MGQSTIIKMVFMTLKMFQCNSCWIGTYTLTYNLNIIINYSHIANSAFKYLRTDQNLGYIANGFEFEFQV